MWRAPHLVQRLVTLRRWQVAHEADVSEELLEVGLAVGMAVLLVVLAAQERLLATRTHEVLNVPLLSQRTGDASIFDGPSARCAHRGDHFVVTLEAVHLAVYFAPIAGQFHTALNAVEVVRVVNFAISPEWVLVNHLIALCAYQLANVLRLYDVVTLPAVRSSVYAEQSLVRKAFAAASAAEAVRVPVPSQSPDQAARDSFVALGARRHEQHAEVVLTVVAATELIIDVSGKPLEALSAYKTFRMPDLATGIDNLLRRSEAVAALGARHHVQQGQHSD